MSDVNRNKLRALATGCRDEVIRSHGWEGTIEEAELIARDRRLLMELSPEVVIQLLDDYDALLVERDEIQRTLTFTDQWYAVRFERLTDLGKSAGCWDAMAAIIANGTADQYEPPTYAQQLVLANHRADVAERERDQLRAELAAIRGQEPVAWATPDAVGGVRWSPGALQQLSDGAPLYALPPQQPDAVSVPREQSDVPLYAAINRACSELPDGWSIELNAERDGAWVALLNAELEVVDFPTNNERLDYTVNDAVEFALLSTRQAEEGE